MAERFRAGRRDVKREAAPPADDRPVSDALARDPTPDEVAMLGELVEGLLRPLNARDRQIAALAFQGYAATEIAAETGASERTIYRTLEGIRGRLRRLNASADD